MQEINEKLDRIMTSLEDIAKELKYARKDTTKMSEHIDTVDFYVSVFDQHFRPSVKMADIKSIEDSLD